MKFYDGDDYDNNNHYKGSFKSDYYDGDNDHSNDFWGVLFRKKIPTCIQIGSSSGALPPDPLNCLLKLLTLKC